VAVDPTGTGTLDIDDVGVFLAAVIADAARPARRAQCPASRIVWDLDPRRTRAHRRKQAAQTGHVSCPRSLPCTIPLPAMLRDGTF
jgi:hypothetical protein